MAIRATVMAEEPCCYICGGMGETSDVVDHVRSLGQGGSHDRSNLRRVHRSCHATKTGKEAAQSR